MYGAYDQRELTPEEHDREEDILDGADANDELDELCGQPCPNHPIGYECGECMVPSADED